MTASKNTQRSPNAPAVSRSWGSIGVSIALLRRFIVPPALFLNTWMSHYTALRYDYTFFEQQILMSGQVWNGGFFERTSLNDLGLCYYIGHQHTACPSSDTKAQVLVIDINGAHRVNVQFCACTEDARWVDKYRQLLRVGWYPSSFERPGTTFTFNVLDSYHKLALQGKLNLYDFYLFLLQKTDNCGRTKAVVGHVCFRVDVSLLTFVVPASVS